MNGQIDLITLISLVVAAVAILKLRSVLGQRTDEDDRRVERLKTRQREDAEKVGAKAGADIVQLPRRDREPDSNDAASSPPAADVETRIRSYPAIDQSITDGLVQIAKHDAALDPAGFVQGASRAYEMIVSAFAEGNKRQLKDLLSVDVYEGFSAAIDERESRGEKVEQQFVGISRAEIVEAEIKAGVAEITVRFVSELITSTKDKDGAEISGDAQKIKDVTDIWTFSRDVGSPRALSNPNWRLAATQAPN